MAGVSSGGCSPLVDFHGSLPAERGSSPRVPKAALREGRVYGRESVWKPKNFSLRNFASGLAIFAVLACTSSLTAKVRKELRKERKAN